MLFKENNKYSPYRIQISILNRNSVVIPGNLSDASSIRRDLR